MADRPTPPVSRAFRVRADVSTPLNADAGWAGALNEPVTITVDRPFRLRIEAVLPAVANAQPLQLQYRRNGGEWFAVGAHDFPYPEREIEIDFADAEAGSTPAGWRVVTGAGADITAAGAADASVLRATAGDEPLIGLYQLPWDLDEFSFAVEYRLPDDGQGSGGIVFGYYRMDGTIWYRRLLADGTLTDPHQLAIGAATGEDNRGPVLPLVYLPETDTTVVIYRLDD